VTVRREACQVAAQGEWARVQWGGVTVRREAGAVAGDVQAWPAGGGSRGGVWAECSGRHACQMAARVQWEL
jgi:hypothetical protein